MLPHWHRFVRFQNARDGRSMDTNRSPLKLLRDEGLQIVKQLPQELKLCPETGRYTTGFMSSGQTGTADVYSLSSCSPVQQRLSKCEPEKRFATRKLLLLLLFFVDDKNFTEISLRKNAMWWKQERLLLIITRSTLWRIVSSTTWLYIRMAGSVAVKFFLFCLAVVNIHLVLLDGETWFCSVYLVKSFILLCNVLWIMLRSVPLVWIVVSSASSSHSARRNHGRSLM